jgi:hypothetical protein
VIDGWRSPPLKPHRLDRVAVRSHLPCAATPSAAMTHRSMVLRRCGIPHDLPRTLGGPGQAVEDIMRGPFIALKSWFGLFRATKLFDLLPRFKLPRFYHK